MILIKNTQRSVACDIQALYHDVFIILKALGYADFDLGIWITTNKTIAKYNREYRHKNKPTDILSFAYQQVQPGQRIKPLARDDKNLGDIIISAEYVKKAAVELNVSFEQRMRVLLVHGICHLLGYDHETDADYKIMRRKELALLKKLS